MLKEFIIKDVRCFAGENRLKIRPLTFLVGENSTGKSTVLGCLQTIRELYFDNDFDNKLDFNMEPYQMGSFSEIARKSSKDASKKFSLGIQVKILEDESVDMFYEFEEKGSEPVVSKTEMVFSKGGKIILKAVNSDDELSRHPFHIKIEKKIADVFIIKSLRFHSFSYLSFLLGKHSIYLNSLKCSDLNGNKKAIKAIKEFNKFINAKAKTQEHQFYEDLQSMLPRVASMPPVRSKPQRTYDPIGETPSPEGGDVPMYLMRLKRTDDGEFKRIQESLHKFGKASGLFSDISVKTYGKGMNEPFQLQVKVRGTKSNILDVGYGISQILPILVRIFADEQMSTFLLQQSEVHLHPRAQAELSSLFISSIAERKQKFIIETHSDYMIDRARIEISKGKISKDDVSLIYMEPKGNQVKAHNIGFDDNGNLLNVPAGYREFFLNESDTFLGFED